MNRQLSMNIAFDLDKIFIDNPPFIPEWLIEKLYKANCDDILLYRIPGKLEQKLRKLSHYAILRPSMKKNIKVLGALAQTKKYNIFLISSRFSFLKNRTEVLVKKHKFSTFFKDMYFNYGDEQPHIFKNRLVKEINIDKFIDDDIVLLEYLAKENPKKLFYWLNNKENKKITNNLFAITDLTHIIE